MEFDVSNYSALRNARKVTALQESSGAGTTTGAVWVTLVSITGTGWLYQLRLGYAPAIIGNQFKVTIDGVSQTIVPGASSPSTPGCISLPIPNVRFDSSVLVEYCNADTVAGTGTANVIWGAR